MIRDCSDFVGLTLMGNTPTSSRACFCATEDQQDILIVRRLPKAGSARSAGRSIQGSLAERDEVRPMTGWNES